MADVKMVVVDGVRYREDEAPKAAPKADAKAAEAPKNKARSASNKKD